MKRERGSIAAAACRGMGLTLEVIVSTLANRDEVRYAVVREDISARENDPDRIVNELLENGHHGFSPQFLASCFIHSTSWRFDPPRSVVLTYFVYSDHDPFGTTPVRSLRLDDARLCSGSSLRAPRPTVIAEENVVAHGLRHLSHLVKQNSQDVRAILKRESVQAFRNMDIGMAGRIR